MRFCNRIAFLLLTALYVNAPATVFAESKNKALLRKQIIYVIDTSNAKVGVGIMGLGFSDSMLINDAHHYPMQSVYKFPIAIAILHNVDQGKLSLTQKVHIPAQYIDTATWSPMFKDFPRGDIDLSLADLLKYVVSKSDNNGCDALLRLAGGPAGVNKYIHSLGVQNIAIATTERQMHTDPNSQYTSWCRPGAMLQLLDILYKGNVLSKTSNDFLIKIMTESENSPNRIKGLLPANTVVAHKTGTSAQNEKGMSAATNDVGIVTLPDGRKYAIVVYVSDYMGESFRGEHIIAPISKLVWDYYTTGK